MLLSILLILHNLVRWVVLFFLVLALMKMIIGIINNNIWKKSDIKFLKRFALWMTIQFVLGTILFFLPNGLVQLAFSNVPIEEIVKNKQLFLFVMIHPGMMFLALALSHMISAFTRKVSGDRNKFVMGLILLTITTIIVFYSIPWSYSDYARPLFRLYF